MELHSLASVASAAQLHNKWWLNLKLGVSHHSSSLKSIMVRSHIRAKTWSLVLRDRRAPAPIFRAPATGEECQRLACRTGKTASLALKARGPELRSPEATYKTVGSDTAYNLRDSETGGRDRQIPEA